MSCFSVQAGLCDTGGAGRMLMGAALPGLAPPGCGATLQTWPGALPAAAPGRQGPEALWHSDCSQSSNHSLILPSDLGLCVCCVHQHWHFFNSEPVCWLELEGACILRTRGHLRPRCAGAGALLPRCSSNTKQVFPQACWGFSLQNL